MTLAQLPLVSPARVQLLDISRAEANGMLSNWGHYLGGFHRPFGAEHVALLVGGRPVSVATSGSIVSTTVAGYGRREVVELARLCSAPDHRWATRVMLRLWREVVAPSWPYWPVKALIAYSQNDRHEGRIYRFDGWQRVTDKAGSSSGGGTWSTTRTTDHVAKGRKSLWLYELAL